MAPPYEDSYGEGVAILYIWMLLGAWLFIKGGFKQSDRHGFLGILVVVVVTIGYFVNPAIKTAVVVIFGVFFLVGVAIGLKETVWR